MQSYIKFVGLFLVVASCSGMGFHLSYRFRCRIRQCRQVEQCLQRLLGEIRFHQIPLEEALRKTGQALDDMDFATFLIRVADGLSREVSQEEEKNDYGDDIWEGWEKNTLAQSWQRELNRYGEDGLMEEEQEWLLSLGKELGALDLEAQIRSLQHCLELWNRHIEELQRREELQGRLYRGIGMSVGAFIAILLL